MSGNFTYKVVEESKEDPIFNTIEKGNVTVKFTLNDLQVNLDTNKKMVKQLEAKLLIEEAKRQNIERNHPFVKDLTPEQCFTVHMYEEAMAVCRSFPAKIAEFKESVEEMEQEKKNIEEQCGVAIPVSALSTDHAPAVEAPEKPVDL